MTFETKLIWLCIFASFVAFSAVYRSFGLWPAMSITAIGLTFYGSERFYTVGGS